MAQMILMIVCFILGIVLRKSKRLPDEAPVMINSIILHVCLPALILLHIHRLALDPNLVYVALLPWLLFALAGSVFAGLGRLLGWSRATIGCLSLVAGLGNTSFVGFPMIEAFYGKEALPIGMILDQVGSFSVLSFAGIALASIYAGERVSTRELVLRIVKFPPTYALFIALCLRPLEYPESAVVILMRLGDMLAPLALIAVGYQLRISAFRAQWRPLSVGVVFKLILAPLGFACLYSWLLPPGQVFEVTIFEAAMPSMITAGIVASQYGLNPSLASLMVGVSIPLSFITLPIWHHVLLGWHR